MLGRILQFHSGLNGIHCDSIVWIESKRDDSLLVSHRYVDGIFAYSCFVRIYPRVIPNIDVSVAATPTDDAQDPPHVVPMTSH